MQQHWRQLAEAVNGRGRCKQWRQQLPEKMDSTRAELLGSYAVMHRVRLWKCTVRVWVDNENVVKGLEKRLGIERADAMWSAAEN